MLKNLNNIGGSKKLSKVQQKTINGDIVVFKCDEDTEGRPRATIN